MDINKNQDSPYSYATIVHTENYENKFPIGFKYQLGNEIYTVESVVIDGNNHSRLLRGPGGSLFSLDVGSIIRDLQQDNARVLEDPTNEKEIEKVDQEPSSTGEPENLK